MYLKLSSLLSYKLLWKTSQIITAFIRQYLNDVAEIGVRIKEPTLTTSTKTMDIDSV